MSKANNSILQQNVSPLTLFGNPDIVLGLRFKCKYACTIYALEFYTQTNNVEIALYDATGNLLTGPDSYGIGGTGFAQLYFNVPYTIAANTEYVAAVGQFNPGYELFTTSPGLPLTNGPFTAINAIQGAGSGGVSYPTTSVSTANTFGVDILTDLFYISDLADSYTLSDAVSIRIIEPKSAADSYTLSDNVNLNFSLIQTETLSITEAIKANWAFSIVDDNSANLGDGIAINFGINFIIIVIDNIQIVDNFLGLVRCFASITGDQLNLADSYNGFSLGISLLTDDTLSLSDALISGGLVLIDFLNILDSIALGFGIPTRFGLDNLIFADAVLGAVTQILSRGDALALSDVVAGNAPPQISADTNTLSDAATFTLASTFLDLFDGVSDSLILSDALNRGGQALNPYLTETVQLSDSVAVLLGADPLGYLRRYLNDVN